MCFSRREGSASEVMQFKPPVEPRECLLTVLIVVLGSVNTQGPRPKRPGWLFFSAGGCRSSSMEQVDWWYLGSRARNTARTALETHSLDHTYEAMDVPVLCLHRP